jgi:ribonuclease-3
MGAQGIDPSLLKIFLTRLQYDFRQPRYIELACTHSSFTNEHEGEPPDNERLEFLGDAVLELAVSHWLFETYPDLSEGTLTQMRARLVNARSLAHLAGQLELGDLLLLGVGEQRSGGRKRPSLLANAMEAVLGAVFLDGGFDMAQQVVRHLFSGRLERLGEAVSQDPKSHLQEWAQATHHVTPCYTVVNVTGPQHDALYESEVSVAEVLSVRGEGRSKKEAEMAAAETAIEILDLVSS